MAKFPYTTSGTTTINADQTITLSWQVKTSTGVLVGSDTETFSAGTSSTEVFKTLWDSARNKILADLVSADLPATFSFTINATDLM